MENGVGSVWSEYVCLCGGGGGGMGTVGLDSESFTLV